MYPRKGKPAARRGRKVTGLSFTGEVAGPPKGCCKHNAVRTLPPQYTEQRCGCPRAPPAPSDVVVKNTRIGEVSRADFLRVSALTAGLLSVGLSVAPGKAGAIAPSGHPRVIANGTRFDAINAGRTADTRRQNDYDALKRVAETEILPSPLVGYQVTGAGERHKTGRELVHRLFALGLLYRLDPANNERFADRAVEEMLSAADFPDWKPQSDLDLGEMTTAVSVGYDWCHDRMDDVQRERVRGAILRLGIRDYMSTPNINYKGNQNQVIHSGIGVGCMAIKGETENEPLVAQARKRVENNLPTGLAKFSPHGATEEGVGYWSYGWQYLTYFFQTTLTAEGAYSPLVNSPGLRDSGYFPLYCADPTGELWRLADSGASTLGDGMARLVAWQGEKYDDEVLRWVGNRGQTVDPSADRQDYAASFLYPFSEGTPPTQLDKNFDGAGIASLRSAWDDPNALFVGFKWGGRAEQGHTHLDRGSFVLTALGQRWTEDLGPSQYSLPGYFDFSSQRWDYYRCRAEGHNTLVIRRRRSGRVDQNPSAAPTRVRESLNSASPFLITDLTPVYGVRDVKRGIKMPDRERVIVQDEVRSKTRAAVWWFMHTTANIVLGEDGRSAILSNGSGKRLWLTIQSPAAAAFSVRDAVPLPSSPNPEGQGRNNGVKKLSIGLSRVTKTRITVLAVPLEAGEPVPTDLPPVVPLAYW